jgi:hypothetical protein
LPGRKSANCRYVHAAFDEAFEAYFAEGIIADSGMKDDTVPEKRKVMGENCRRAAERQGQIRGEMLAIEFKMARKAIQDEVQIELADDTNTELVLADHPSRFTSRTRR